MARAFSISALYVPDVSNSMNTLRARLVVSAQAPARKRAFTIRSRASFFMMSPPPWTVIRLP